jgi:broad specificity phosphatase PhoE
VIYLARHGETAYNAEGRFQGQGDVGLTDKGIAQAHALAEASAGHGIVRLVSSPLRRARQTADIVAAALGLAVEEDDRFRETDTGDWTDRTFPAVERDEPDGWAAYHATDPEFRFPGGESLAEQTARVFDGLGSVEREGRLPALVVCHRGVIRCIRSRQSPDGLRSFMSFTIANGTLEAL